MEKNNKNNAVKKRRGPWRKVKRALAVTMAALMVVTSPMPGFSMVSLADTLPSTELIPDTTMKENSAGLTTAYAWKMVPDNLYQYFGRIHTFDIEGIKLVDNMNRDGGYTGQFDTGVRTTCYTMGYVTQIQQGDNYHYVDIPFNGGVVKYEDMGVEVRIKIHPSPDHKLIFADYAVYNNRNAPNTIQIGSGTDVQIGGQDASDHGYGSTADCAELIVNDNGFHMVNDNLYNDDGTLKKEGTQESFDLKYNDAKLGLTMPDTRWIGSTFNFYPNNSPDNRKNFFSDHHDALRENTDSALAYSWTIPLGPHETATRRVAFSAKAPTFYVNYAYGDNRGTGAADNPLETIEGALDKIGNRLGYIYIQGEAPSEANPNEIVMDHTITIPSTANVTIMSADYDRASQPTDATVTLARADGFDGPMFSTAGGTMQFGNLVMDGESKPGCQPFLTASAGKVGVQSGLVLKNNEVSDLGKGSAIDVTGSASLEMNFGKITGNASKDRGAVNFSSTGSFSVLNDIDISGNTAAGDPGSAAKPANVYLAEGNHVTVEGDLGDSKIGVTTAATPEASPGGTASEPGQEVLVAAPAGGYEFTGPSPFLSNFTTDDETSGVYLSAGTVGENAERNAVLKKDAYTISFHRTDGTGTLLGGEPIASMEYAPGAGVTISPDKAGAAPTGYKLTGVTTDAGFTVHSGEQGEGAPADYTVTGTMPSRNVTVSYVYEKIPSGITFHANGGTPEPPPLAGNPGDPINSLIPSCGRYGYKAKNPDMVWAHENDRDTQDYLDRDTEWSTYPASMMDLYAIFVPDDAVTFGLAVEHAAKTGHSFFTADKAYKHVEEGIGASTLTIPGYKWSENDSSTTPDLYNYGTRMPQTPADTPVDVPIPIGSFAGNPDAAGGSFAGYMPAQDATISFVYVPDAEQTSLLTVNYETEGGNAVAPSRAEQLAAETPIEVAPVDKYGYECESVEISAGNAAHSLEGNYTVVDDFQGLTLSSRMPNQPVTVTYTYKVTDEGYPLIANYIDDGAADAGLKNIISPVVRHFPADGPVGMPYQPQYGYDLASQAMTPDPSQTHLGFDGDHGITGTMYDDTVTATYRHGRKPGKWADVTYKLGDGEQHGRLSGDGAPADLRVNNPGTQSETYTAQALTSDGTDLGNQDAWTLKKLGDKGLTPAKAADQYYKFGFWYIDEGEPGYSGEAPLTDESYFTGTAPVTLSAHFIEDPDQWRDVTLKAGDHGYLTGSAPQQKTFPLHIQKDKDWGEALAKAMQEGLDCTPEANYLQEGSQDAAVWRDGGNARMNADSALTDGGTYTTSFYKDPHVFGTDASAPVAEAGLGGNGSGTVTVYNASQGYRYVLADRDGKTVAFKDGSPGSSRVSFPGLLPGTRYKVYEAPGGSQAAAGEAAAGIPGISGGTDVLTPVVDDANHQIAYDENDEGKTRLTIKPAWAASDYALLDESGNAVTTPQTGAGGWQSPKGSPASLTFSGLGYNKKYTVVARPKEAGADAEDLLEDGSAVTTDPGGDIRLAEYIVKVNHGTIQKVVGERAGVTGTVPDSVETDCFDKAHEGDEVYLTADATSDGMPFDHWEFTIGSAEGFGRKVGQREFSLTMPRSNLVLTAIYKRPAATPRKASVRDEVRGGSREELALSPDMIPGLEAALTTQEDSVLLNTNDADVGYRVVYQKTGVKATESNAVKAASAQFQAHGDAYKCAWGLDVSMERYVDGRRVDRGTPSDASFATYVQLDKEDVDMTDYEFYDVTPDDSGHVTPVQIQSMPDLEETGGLFAFEAKEGHRYVMAYSRAYRMNFWNNTKSIGGEGYHYTFKVRRNESPDDAYYAGGDSYGGLQQGGWEDFYGPTGARYWYEGWSYREDRDDPFRADKAVTRKTNVYAYFDSNLEEVNNARKELQDYVDKMIAMSGDPFLWLSESQDLKAAINAAQQTLDNAAAQEEDLATSLEALQGVGNDLEKKLEHRYHDYGDKQQNGDKGGSGGGGGGGVGTKRNPYNATAPKSYRIGTNGDWAEEKDPDGRTRRTFMLNGGMLLRDMWAKLEYPDGQAEGGTGWYRFDDQGAMESGWVCDNGTWYYCNTEQDGNYGRMATDWRLDGTDGNWYYLDPGSGAMAVGWKQIGGKWYYFNPAGGGTYSFDPAKEQWTYGGGSGRPLGAMYKDEETPDGCMVGLDGAWIQ